jgi:hypothetical protein
LPNQDLVKRGEHEICRDNANGLPRSRIFAQGNGAQTVSGLCVSKQFRQFLEERDRSSSVLFSTQMMPEVS